MRRFFGSKRKRVKLAPPAARLIPAGPLTDAQCELMRKLPDDGTMEVADGLDEMVVLQRYDKIFRRLIHSTDFKAFTLRRGDDLAPRLVCALARRTGRRC